MNKMRVYAEINLNNVKKNVEAARNVVGNDTKIMAVIKADGYGHGAVMCAKATADVADCYAVATIEEAIELRNNGVSKDILILSYIFPNRYEEAIENNISMTVFDYKSAKGISDAAAKMNKSATIHIAVDTGMGRIGFLANDESVAEIKKIVKLPMLNIEGLFSHFATSDEKDKTYSRKQLEKFQQFINSLKENNIEIKTVHIDNSAAVTEIEDSHFDMVRIGIILYGLYPSGEVDKSKIALHPVMEFKSSVINLKTIKKGDSVSYGCHFIAQKDTRVATVSVGYADGYPRLLSNRGRVIINGKYAPVIGNVCMDQIMVDVTEIDDITVGDAVILIGKCGEIEVTADEVAALAGTINYEIVCGVGKRVPRVYI